MHELQSELEARWREMFTALVGGDDVTPTRRLRTEGLMEAAQLLGIATPEALTDAMNRCYGDVCGRSLEQDYGDDWQALFPFPQIPAMMQRAPVYPSTPD